MRWPWSTPRETRADSSYTDALIASLAANAAGQIDRLPDRHGGTWRRAPAPWAKPSPRRS